MYNRTIININYPHFILQLPDDKITQSGSPLKLNISQYFPAATV